MPVHRPVWQQVSIGHALHLVNPAANGQSAVAGRQFYRTDGRRVRATNIGHWVSLRAGSAGIAEDRCLPLTGIGRRQTVSCVWMIEVAIQGEALRERTGNSNAQVQSTE
jgi:hypothetical protein